MIEAFVRYLLPTREGGWMRIRVLVSILALMFTAAGADAANEISNGDFDTDVSGWLGNTTFVADLDVGGNPASGSLRVDNVNPGTGTQAIQRIPVTPGTPIRASFRVYIASGQSGPGYAYPGVNFYEGACDSGGSYLSNVNAQLVSEPFDTWLTSEMPETLPPETSGCAEVILFVRNDGSGTFSANFDAIFAPEPGVSAAGLAAVAALALRRRALSA
jgi:hypothetical protein